MITRVVPGLALLLLAAAAAHAAPPRPLEYDREVTAADLDGRTLRELSLMRNYVFARAGQPFRKPWINAFFRKQPWYKPLADPRKVKAAGVGVKNARIIGDYETHLSRTEIDHRRKRLADGQLDGMTREEAAIETTLLTNLVGGKADAKVAVEAGDSEANPMDDPSLLDGQVLKPEQLRELSRRELRILRNMVYARRGRKFRSPLLQEYFDRMEWYRVDPGYTDKKITRNDERNIRLIRSVEDQIGGPITDDEERKDDGFLGGA